MSILTTWFTRLFFENPARRTEIPQFVVRLGRDGDHIMARFIAAADSAKNRDQLCRLMGIERWAQSRLQVVLGDPLVMDTPDSYRPDENLDQMALAEMFRETRHATIILARMIYQFNAEKTLVPHNLLGPLTASGWLRYIHFQTHLESWKIK
jgi:hypothetical protein